MTFWDLPSIGALPQRCADNQGENQRQTDAHQVEGSQYLGQVNPQSVSAEPHPGSVLLKIEGHIQYYGVSFNIRAVQTFQMKATRILFKWLNRRSQRRSFNWEQFALYIRANPLPKVTICHALV